MSGPPRLPDVQVTPEAVALRVDVAGLGSRFIAVMIDSLIQTATILILGLAVGPGLSALGVSDSVTLPLFIAVVGLVFLGYYPILEIMMHGRTVGKRAQGLRVVQTDGQPARAGTIVLRELMRIVDYLPSSYLIGALAILLSKRSQRVGDMVAGTIVVRERKIPPPQPPEVPLGRVMDPLPDTAGLTEQDYAAVRAYLQRRAGLDPAARRELAERLARALEPRVGAMTTPDAETFLDSIARSYRARFTTP